MNGISSRKSTLNRHANRKGVFVSKLQTQKRSNPIFQSLKSIYQFSYPNCQNSIATVKILIPAVKVETLTVKIQTPTVKIQSPTVKIQIPIEKMQFSTVKIQSQLPKLKFQL